MSRPKFPTIIWTTAEGIPSEWYYASLHHLVNSLYPSSALKPIPRQEQRRHGDLEITGRWYTSWETEFKKRKREAETKFVVSRRKSVLGGGFMIGTQIY